MKKSLIVFITVSLCFTIYAQDVNYDRMIYNYCKFLGYEVKFNTESKKYVTVLPNGEEVDPRYFFLGKVGQEFSYCALKGYKIRLKGVTNYENTYKYPVCYQDTKDKVKEEIYLLSLMYKNGDYSKLFAANDSSFKPPTEPKFLSNPRRRNSIIIPMTPWSGFDWRNQAGKNFLTEQIQHQGISDMCAAVATAAAAEGASNKEIHSQSWMRSIGQSHPQAFFLAPLPEHPTLHH
ncbi:MAG: hypothetical protein D4R64_17345 [Porphyromonadaceae bacterium]|nr:MAG: hypothetical protein D4R64_17345 [Porphyromonadaceae bacterium]